MCQSLPCSSSYRTLGSHTNRVGLRELELESVCFVRVERVGIEDFNVEQPLLEVLGGYERNSRRQACRDLKWVPC